MLLGEPGFRQRLTGPQASNDFGVPREGSGTLMDRLFTEFNLPREYAFAPMAPGYKPLRAAWDNYTNMDGFGEKLIDIGYFFNGRDGANPPKLERNIWDDDLARTPWSPALRSQVLAPAPGTTMARRRGTTAAYEDLLVQAARALGVEDTLSEVPEGTDREAERLRIEHLLREAGLALE